MLRKKESFTVITPIPGFIPRQLALDILHSHSEVITLNPLVLEHKPIAAPRNAAADEYYSTWYEITQRIQFVPGMGNVGAGKVTFNGCFHDMPWGLQTHIYVPFSVDMRNKYRVAGNQPGIEQPEQREIGLEKLGAPADGLYLREDIEIKCNIAMVSFVKSQAKAASKEMVQRIIKKAELLDAGVLKAMMEDGRLKTYNPNDLSIPSVDRTNSVMSPSRSPSIGSPGLPYQQHNGPYQLPGSSPGQQYAAPGSYYTHHQGPGSPPPMGAVPKEFSAPVELPADMYQQNLQPPGYRAELGTDHRHSTASSDPRWSQGQLSPSLADTHRTSMSSVASGAGVHPGQPSPGYARQGFASELASHQESRDEKV